MPIRAVRFLRKMRGGAQAHLFEARAPGAAPSEQRDYYVVKFVNNPQHRRILVNELVACTLLDYLQISSAPGAIVDVTPDLLAATPEIYLQLGHQRAPVPPGWHFGSQCPGNPDTLAIFDFVPDSLLFKVANLRDFLGVLVFDKWIANADARQCIFFRTRLREFAPAYADHPLKVGYLARMIDHGFAFNGPHWELPDSPIQGLYMRTSVYAEVRGWEDFEPWLERVVNFPEHVVDRALRQVPPQWLDGDEDALEGLLERLMHRRRRVPDLIRDAARSRVNPFPGWDVK